MGQISSNPRHHLPVHLHVTMIASNLSFILFILVGGESAFADSWTLSSAVRPTPNSTSTSASTQAPFPHFDLNMSGTEYRRLIESDAGLAHAHTPAAKATEEPVLDQVLEMGKRNLDWLVRINAGRRSSGRNTLSFSTPETQQGFPIEAPRIYSPSIILTQFEDLKRNLPPEMKRVLIEGKDATDETPIDEKTYLEFGLRADRIYQIAARWLLMKPYLAELGARKKEDVRGYYFLSRENDLKSKLDNFSSMSPEEKSRLSEWLMGLCYISASESFCRKALDRASASGRVWEFFESYLPAAKKLWESYFAMPDRRRDVKWNSSNHPELMIVPFLKPDRPEIAEFVRHNVEDEWRWKSWQLKLDFVTSSDLETTRIEFEPGSTPHVNRIAGSVITMDANAPLSEYDVRWTIRHEYGHTLGFPDCYVEFYDSKAAQIVSYQIDISNLMCSRRGHFKEIHFEELKRAYLR